jgi:hypothetical protein
MSTPGASEPRIYQLRITLRHIRPPIWRRVLVPGDVSLGELHDVIQSVMGWQDYHLHQFQVGNVVYGMDPEEDAGWGLESVDERRSALQDVARREKSRFDYEYDFGDGWHHEILVEKILPPEEGKRYPVCTTGKRSAPPEDSGGPYHYGEFLEALRNPDHPDHEETVEWAGRFDPERFNLDAVNARLAALQMRRRGPIPPEAGREPGVPAALAALRVPKALRPRGGAMMGLTDRFIAEHLDADYVQPARRILASLARKRPSPLLGGEPRVWAAAVLHVIVAVNAVFEPSGEFPPKTLGAQLAQLAGLSEEDLWQQGEVIIRMLRLNPLDFVLPRNVAPATEFTSWLLAVESGLADARFPPPAIADLVDRMDALEDLLEQEPGGEPEREPPRLIELPPPEEQQ